MASQTLRPHRSPSPSPSPAPVNNSNPAKLTRQSLGPPPAASGAPRGFGSLGVSSPTFPSTGGPHPRHVSSSVALGAGGNRESMVGPRPSLGAAGRAVSGAAGPRPSSEFLPSGAARDARTPEAEQIDLWFKHLASWEQTLEEMAAASTDQNFTEELGAIEQWFRVLSEAERTAALYSLLQHSTPVQIRFFLSVLHHMAQQDPMTAVLSPNPAAANMSMQAQMESKLASMNLKSPSAGGGSGFTGSPNLNQYLAPDSVFDPNAVAQKKGRNRISAPGTLQPSDRWQGQLDQVIERGTSPGAESASNRSGSPAPDTRPKSADFSGKARDGDIKSPRLSGGSSVAGGAAGSTIGLGIGAPPDLGGNSPMNSPFFNSGSWASMSNTPLVPMFTDPKVDNLQAAINMASLQMAASGQPGGRVNLEDARKFRRPGAGTTSRNVSGFEEALSSPLLNQQWARSPVMDQFGLGGLGLGSDSSMGAMGMNFASLGLNPLAGTNAAQMLALAQAQQQLNTAAMASAAYNGQPGGLAPNGRGIGRLGGFGGAGSGRRSPMLGKSHSPSPGGATTGGGAGSGGGVAGPDDVEVKVIQDIPGWLRVLRLHKYTSNFDKSTWQEMVIMTDQDLQDKGVAAQGARTKFLKVFYNVREHENMPHPPGQEEYAPSAAKSEDK
ncbi:hypothetical protein TREMEDRAFT_36653 [Tremella mesenterica DSM 1558]|uniref:uncharacterized protein n=1 Tax=Tremella mesenterica (strain ATCC 24925 / CBS 8224 / DSM 1558 / NBRC 9311 / NRRL Y-6157 / RJB 2259-6 / UBC 559-6) TaxID=578456 RepID=UPI0003F497C2|nr:uncharacterized protein TREMEDRAFT_36653 [Tremella mesenterica DSM 1558]EIW72378.1 hypothetical protein TREMEDRAFT_36653 [Tremella mesenterica DSM 1558]